MLLTFSHGKSSIVLQLFDDALTLLLKITKICRYDIFAIVPPKGVVMWQDGSPLSRFVHGRVIPLRLVNESSFAPLLPSCLRLLTLKKSLRVSSTMAKAVAPSATTLRWRSRVTKVAASSVDEDEEDDVRVGSNMTHNHNNSAISETLKSKTSRTSFSANRALIWTALAALAVGCNIYNLRLLHTWFVTITCALNVVCALLSVWQRQRLRRLGNLRSIHNKARMRVQQMHSQNERLYRHLTSLDRSVDRLQAVQASLDQIVGEQRGQEDWNRLGRVVTEYRDTQDGIKMRLQQQAQERILRVVLQTDSNANFELSGQETERLVLQLSNLPGLSLHELQLREVIANSDKSLSTIVRLLKQVVEDGKDPDHASVFEFDARSAVSESHDANLLGL